MSSYMIYTYSGMEQLRQIQQEKEVLPFIFAEIKDSLEENPNICIDISTLIYLLRTNKENLYSANINLREMTDDTIIIVEETLVDDAMSFFPYVFYSSTTFFQEPEISKTGDSLSYIKIVRKPIYTYNNTDDLSNIISYADKHHIPITTFSRASGDLRRELEKFNQSAEIAIIDLTSTTHAIEDNKNLIYTVELFLNAFQNIKIIVLTTQVDKIIKYFPLYIESQKPINDLLPDIENITSIETSDEEVRKITALLPTEFELFIKNFKHNLIGHEYFKQRFEYIIKNFIRLNKAQEQKVLSVFLFGSSGIGKTEVARLIVNGLKPDGYLAKINFQNYSSQDALNSLIGSPAGYIGCEHGELSEKVKKSKIGIILCDEFDKTNRPVFSFFLELLEEGKFTDSMAREYDVDGYVIVFTSNIPNEAEYKKTIPPELQTRFDLVCEFQAPSYSEKVQFIDLLYERAKSKFTEQFSRIKITPSEKQQLYDFDYSTLNSLRDIKRQFNNRLMDMFYSKGL